ncbi:MAG: pilus assembly protein PilM [Synergistaceae bacterium]|jgi:type IV pilus assembly protein PilM|nr:pilus assembly protein PilM [Synergistaceae bacterium]
MALLGGKEGKTRAGLFIFGGMMQYVVLSRQSGKTYRLEECIDAPYDTGAMGGEIFSNQEVIEDNLKVLKKQVGRKWADRVYAAIQSKDVLLRTVELPQMDLADVKESFRFEFDKFFPIPVDEAIYDVALVDRPGGEDDVVASALTQCIASAVRVATVENLMMAAFKHGLKLSGIEPSPVAMLRCLMGPGFPSGFNVYALAGLVSSVIIASYRDNGIVYRNTTQAFAADDPSGRNVANFTRDLQATIKFATTQMRGFVADKVYIGGYGLTHSQSLKASVEDMVNSPVETVNPWELWTIGNQPKQTYGWEAALGLALRPSEVR